MPVFTVELEYPPPRKITSKISRVLKQAMQNEVELSDSLQSGGLVVRINRDAESALEAQDAVRQLIQVSLRDAPAALRQHPVTCARTAPIADYDKLGELVGVAEIAELLNVSRQRASRIARGPSFPAPAQKLKMGPVYTRRAVLRSIGERAFHMPAGKRVSRGRTGNRGA